MYAMELQEFKEKAEQLTDEFQQLIDELPQKGDKIEDCQKVCLQQHLNELASAVTGTEDSDMKADTHTCINCCWEGMEDDLKTNTDLSGETHDIGYNKCCPICRSEDIEEL